jgi:hypothetical protein
MFIACVGCAPAAVDGPPSAAKAGNPLAFNNKQAPTPNQILVLFSATRKPFDKHVYDIDN